MSCTSCLWTRKSTGSSPGPEPPSAARSAAKSAPATAISTASISSSFRTRKSCSPGAQATGRRGTTRATWEFSPVAGGTRMIFTQSGVPDDQYESIAQGWRDYYWESMKETLEK
ncbi:MAG: hypothetical protein C4542_08740 [Dehalococcoidia bacterium]|nr:MAG: hypothetical protein C4542_08740 [Dehalococcoidia bacterium]